MQFDGASAPGCLLNSVADIARHAYFLNMFDCSRTRHIIGRKLGSWDLLYAIMCFCWWCITHSAITERYGSMMLPALLCMVECIGNRYKSLQVAIKFNLKLFMLNWYMLSVLVSSSRRLSSQGQVVVVVDDIISCSSTYHCDILTEDKSQDTGFSAES